MPVKFKCNEPLPLKAVKLVKIMILELNTYVLPKTILRTQSYLRKGRYMKKSQDFCFAKVSLDQNLSPVNLKKKISQPEISWCKRLKISLPAKVRLGIFFFYYKV